MVNKSKNKKSKESETMIKWLKSLLLVLIFIFIGVLISYLVLLVNVDTNDHNTTTSKVTLSVTPLSEKLSLNQDFTFNVYVDTDNQSVNVVTAKLNYPSDKFEFVNIDTSESEFGVQAVSTGGSGNIEITRGSVTPINSTNALVGKVTLKPIVSSEKAIIGFTSSANVISSTTNTNILNKTINGSFSIL
ncbi:MAG: hypothetical protein U0451_01765 [Candidatus Saccharimonadales bacterium]